MSDIRSIRVLIVDDHAMVRTGLATFLQVSDDLDLVGQATNGQEAVELCEQFQPDVVLMDLVMPEMDGVTATRIIRERWPQVQVIALTSFQEQELVQDALQAGTTMGDLVGDASQYRFEVNEFLLVADRLAELRKHDGACHVLKSHVRHFPGTPEIRHKLAEYCEGDETWR